MPAKWLTEAEAREYLHGAFYGRLATAVDGQPYITPVNFALAGDKIYIHCHTQGRKLDNIRQNAQVCFEVSEPVKLVKADMACDFAVRFKSVLVFGPARILEEAAEKLPAMEAIVAKYAAGHPVPPLRAEQTGAIKIIEITIESISGKINVDPE